MYEVKGRNAIFELDVLKRALEVLESERSIVEKSRIVDELLVGDWLQEKYNMANNNAGLGGRGSNTGHASVLQGKSPKFIGSRTFRNVVKNLLDIQEERNAVKLSVSTEPQDRIENIVREEIFSVPKYVTSKLSNQIERWLNGEMTSNGMFEFANTPVVLRELGAENLPAIMSQNTMVKLNGEKHSVSLENIRNLPQNLAEPLMVFKSATVPNAFLILTQIEDMNGKPVVVALHLNKTEKHIEVNRIASVYSKNNILGFLSTKTKKGNLRYIDKIKSQNWSQSRGLQLPKLADTNPDNNSILEKEDIVNKYYVQKKVCDCQ